MAGFAFSLFLLGAACGVLAAGRRSKAGKQIRAIVGPWPARAAALVLGVIGVLVLFFGSLFVAVPSQDLGILTTYGATSGHLGAGPHLKSPWQGVTTIDESVQNSDYSGPTCVFIRLADQQTACATIKVRWKVNPANSDQDFRSYKGTNGTTAAMAVGLVEPELQNTANSVFKTYDPVALLSSTIKPGQRGNPTVAQLAAQVESQLAAQLRGQVDVLRLFIPSMNYQGNVQPRINQVLTQQAATLVADQDIQTENAQAQAYEKLAKAIASNPNALVSKCMDNQAEMIKNGQTPVTSCWPGSGNSNTAVVTPTR